MSLTFFEKLGFSPTNIVTKTANYTALVTDDEIDIGGSGVILTLPSLLSLQGTLFPKKMYYIYNNSTAYALTIQPGTNSDTNVANTINSHATWVLKPLEKILISGYSNLLDWGIASPATLPVLGRNYFVVQASTSGTTPQNVFDANGAPAGLYITAVLITALDTNAGNIIVKTGTSVVNDSSNGTAKSVTAGLPTGAVAISNPNVASGAVCTVESSTTNGNGSVLIFGSTQALVTFAN
jgi:hypothetical protein